MQRILEYDCSNVVCVVTCLLCLQRFTTVHLVAAPFVHIKVLFWEDLTGPKVTLEMRPVGGTLKVCICFD